MGRERRRGCLIYWFNSCQCSSLSLSVREGKWSMQPITPRPNHIFSQLLSLTLVVFLASLCLSLAPSLTLALSFCLSIVFFSLLLTHSLAGSLHPSAWWKWKTFESSTYLKEFATRRLCVCWFRSLFIQPDHQNKPEKWDIQTPEVNHSLTHSSIYYIKNKCNRWWTSPTQTHSS